MTAQSGLARFCERRGLQIALILTVVLRMAASIVLVRPVQDDSLAYMTMARSLAQGGSITDQFGHHAFFSPGYPLLLAPFFKAFGAALSVAVSVNLALAALSAWLVWRIARLIGIGPVGATLAALAYAVWLPGIWGATDLARENLSAPLLLGFVAAALAVRGPRPLRAAAIAGLCYGCGLLAGTSVLASVIGMAVALLLLAARRGWPLGIRAGLVFVVALLLPVTPWLVATHAMLGRTTMTTSGAFNLYIGNNPAANGRFVSVRDTPAGPIWHAQLDRLGEAGTSDWIGQEAKTWMLAHPARVVELSVTKLLLFWEPNIPDAADFAQSRALAALRLIEVAQYLVIIALAILALVTRRLVRADIGVVTATIAGFWLLHGIAYIIPRYRDPVMPLLIVLAAAGAMALLDRKTAHVA